MAQVTLLSYTTTPPRAATFSVDGEEVTRPISQEVTDETLEAHLVALAQGLAIECAEKELAESPALTLSEGLVAAGTVLVASE